MTDLNKEEQACLGAFESMWDGFCEAYGNGHDQALAKMFFHRSMVSSQSSGGAREKDLLNL
ncbi:hypothetical protein ACAY51_000854 [Acinetobacter baumannii]